MSRQDLRGYKPFTCAPEIKRVKASRNDYKVVKSVMWYLVCLFSASYLVKELL